MAQLHLDMNGHQEELWAYVTPLTNYPIILGMNWLEQHNPAIDWKKREVTFNSKYCRETCLGHGLAASIYSPGYQPKEPLITPPTTNCHHVSAPAFYRIARRKGWTVAAASRSRLYELDKEQDHVLYSNRIDIVDLPEDDAPTELYGLSPLDFEKFMKLKKGLTNEELRKLLPKRYYDFTDMCSQKGADTLPPHRPDDHAINIEQGKMPPYKRPYPMSKDELLVVKKYIDEHLDKGFIRPSMSPAAAPILLAKKPGGGIRFCVDYRGLNAITIKNRYPVPLIRETLERLSQAKIYTKLDIIAAFNHLRIREGDEWKTAFASRFGQFEYTVMPFGVCNGPGTFQSYINNALRDYLDDFCSAYLDDILIYSDDPSKHTEHVRKVLQRLRDAGLHIDLKKCEFSVTEVKYLGLIVTTKGVRMDPEKVRTITEWQAPNCIKDVQAFLGFANFYRKFIYNFSGVVAPLTAMMRTKGLSAKGRKTHPRFTWTPECEKAFQDLKNAFTKAPILAHFTPGRQLYLETDSSDHVNAGVLSQMGDDGLLHPVAFYSSKLTPQECNYEIYDKELLAIVRAFEEFRPELSSAEPDQPTEVLTDHRNLEYFMTTKQLNRRQARWNEFLSGFNFKIAYRPGVQGTKPDSLTRRSQDLPQSKDDPRNQFQQQTILKARNLAPGILPTIEPTIP